MYINPNTTIKILKNIPLNKSYEHTVRYADKDAQYNAFNKYTKFTLENYSYQRTNIGTLRVELKYEQLYDCNYLLFKNTSFENKWFYAFITGVAYISDNVSEVYYELDVMQTWAYDYSFMRTFVERQHATDDTPYSNTQPEGLELGSDYVYQANHVIRLFDNLNDQGDPPYTILATTYSNGQKPTTRMLNGALFSLAYLHYDNLEDAKKDIQDFVNNGYESNIISIYTTPLKAVDTLEYKRPTTVDGYSPKNNKLFCYPFTYVMLYNNLGESIDLKYENFGKKINEELSFIMTSIDAPVPTAKLFPTEYLESGYSFGALHAVTYSQFPTGAFSGDSFQVWLAQNKNSYGASLNAIQNSYDTNMAIAQNSYAMAQRSAMASAENANASTATGLANAQSSNATARDIATMNRSYNQANNVIGGATGILANAVKGDVIGGIASGINAGMSMVGTEIEYQNTNNALNTAMQNAQNSAGTAYANTERALSTSLKNASTTQASATLSALTASQNATAQLVAKKQDAMHVPTNLHGAMMNDSWNGGNNLVGFTIYDRSIKKEYAEMIDQYFDKYGYAQRKMYVPTLLNRPHWSYLQTVGCNIKGNLNNSDLIAIKGIYDNGITTWDNLENVGNYSLSNK